MVMAALSSGLKDRLKYTVDRFIDFDSILLVDTRHPDDDDFYHEFFATVSKSPKE